MPRILLENDSVAFRPDRTAIVESKDPVTGLTNKRIPGTLSVCDCVNGNRRKYGKRVWEKNLAKDSILAGLMSRRASFGLLEHPADGKVDLRSPISHITVDAQLTEGIDEKGEKRWYVKGIIEVLGTPEGLKLSSLIQGGYDPLVSSRGYGSLVTGPDGIDEVQEDFICEGWDVVSTPSFVQAALKPQRSAVTTEAAAPTVTAPIISAPAPSSAKSPEAQKTTPMDITKIKESISSLRAVSPASLDARSFASGFLRMSELHNAAAKHLSENASASWEVDQMHKEISAIEESWNKAFEAPRVEVKQLKENQNKLLTVVKKLTGIVTERNSVLSDIRGKFTKANGLAETIAGRGRSWMEAARRERDSAKLFEKKFVFCTEALDIMAARYKADVAEVGARVLELEFPTMSPAQKKALGEAKTPHAVLAVRESIEAAAPAKAPVTEAKTAPVTAPVTQVTESKTAPAAAAPVVAPVVAAPAEGAPRRSMTEGVEILRSEVTHSVLESAGMARRLSQSTRSVS